MENAKLIAALQLTIKHLRNRVFTESLKRKPLVFGFENTKLKGIHTFSLPSGWTCPGASICLAKFPRLGGKLEDGPDAKVRCFSASQEAAYPSVREIRWHNYDLLQSALTYGEKGVVKLILDSLPADAKIVRVHVAGDFFSYTYFRAWMEVAKKRPGVLFYAYTKSLHYWNAYFGPFPTNFRLVASCGGKFDHFISKNCLRYAKIFLTAEEAYQRGFEVDTDDSHAYAWDGSFALVIHGTQQAGSAASKAWQAQIEVKKADNKGKAPKAKRPKAVPTVESLTQQILKLSARLSRILKQPEFVVASL